MANPYGSVTATGYNSNPPPDDGSSSAANEITWAGIKTKIGDPLKTEIDAINTNVLSAFTKIFANNISSISTDYTALTSDQGKLLATSGTHTITLPAAASAATPFTLAVLNAGTGTTTIDGNASETIDTALSISLLPTQWAILICDGSNWRSLKTVAPVLSGYLFGCTLSRNTGSPNTKIDIQPGQACDGSGLAMMNLAAVATVDTGTVGANGLDTGTLAASKWYHVWVIGKLDGTTAGFMDRADLAGLSPTLPAGYVFKRRVGEVLTNGSTQFIDFIQRDDSFFWQTPVQDQNATALTAATPVSLTLASVPLGLRVRPLMNVEVIQASGATARLRLYSPDLGDNNNTNNMTLGFSASATVPLVFAESSTNFVNLTQQIRVVAPESGVTVTIFTNGWLDTRGRNS